MIWIEWLTQTTQWSLPWIPLDSPVVVAQGKVETPSMLASVNIAGYSLINASQTNKISMSLGLVDHKNLGKNCIPQKCVSSLSSNLPQLMGL